MAKIKNTKFIAIQSILCAIILIFVFFPRLTGLAVAVVPLIAISISGSLYGFKSGLFSGAFFGVISLISHIANPSLLSSFFYNPLISVGARIFVGLAPALVIYLFRNLKINMVFKYALSSLSTVIINTLFVLGGILLFYNGRVLDSGTAININWVKGIVIGNSILEIIVVTLVSPPIIMILRKILMIK